jgi:hypothetical protein
VAGKRDIVKTDEIMKPPGILFISSSKQRRMQKAMPVSKTCHQYGSTQLLHINIPSGSISVNVLFNFPVVEYIQKYSYQGVSPNVDICSSTMQRKMKLSEKYVNLLLMIFLKNFRLQDETDNSLFKETNC